MMVKQLKILGALAVLIALFLMSGCATETKGAVDDQKAAKSDTETVQSEKAEIDNPTQKLKVKVYFSNQDATKVVAEEREVLAEDKYTAVVQELINGTSQEHLVSLIPKSTILKSVTVSNGIAYVDFDDSIVRKFNGGSGAEIILVASIVNTLTEFSEIDKVQLLLNGASMETIAGHLDTSKPFARMQEVL